MKTHSAKLFLFVCASLFAFACDKEDDPAPVPAPESALHPVAQVLEGSYWKEKICFTYLDNLILPEPGKLEDEEQQGVEVKISEDIIQEFKWDGGTYLNARLDKFYVDPKTKKVHSYFDGSYIGNWYYQNLYTISYPDSEHVVIGSSKDLNALVGAAINTPLKVVSCTESEIVLDGPIKPYIWQNWRLDKTAETSDIIYLGIRVYWTRIENGAELLEPSNPLD